MAWELCKELNSQDHHVMYLVQILAHCIVVNSEKKVLVRGGQEVVCLNRSGVTQHVFVRFISIFIIIYLYIFIYLFMFYFTREVECAF